VCSAGFGPATSGISGRPLCQLEYEHLEPPGGIEPPTWRLQSARSGHLSYEGAAAGQRLELRFTAPEAAVLPLDDPAWSALPGGRTLTVRLLKAVPLPVGLGRLTCAVRITISRHPA
jgi:hypothetical protein